MKKLLAGIALVVFVGGAFALYFSATDSADRTEQVIKKPGELVAIEPACGDIEVPVVEYAAYHALMIEEDATAGSLPRAMAHSPPVSKTDERPRIRADTKLFFSCLS